MDNNHWLTSITNKANVSETLLEVIQDTDKLKVEINNISANDGNVNIELLQFVSTFSVHQQLEREKQLLVSKLSKETDSKTFQELSEEYERKSTEQKEFIKEVLLSANAYTQVRSTTAIANSALLFFSGDIKEAFESIDAKELESTQSKLLESIKIRLELQKAYRSIEDNANEFQIKGQLTILNYDIAEPNDRLQKAIFYMERGKISASKTSNKEFTASYSFKYASFLNDHFAYDSAVKNYLDALEVRKTNTFKNQESNEINIATILNNLGNLYKNTSNYKEAESSHLEALHMRRERMHAGEPKSFDNLAMSYHNLATLYAEINETEKVENHYLESIALRRTLVEIDPNTYLAELALSLNNIAIFYRDQKQFKKALEYHNEAIEARRELCQHDKDKHLSDLSVSLHNIGIVYMDVQDFEASARAFDEALVIRRALASKNPVVYNVQLANTIGQIAALKNKTGQPQEAIKLSEEAIEIAESLAKQNPVAHSLNHWVLLQNHATYLQSNQNYKDSEAYFNKAFKMFSQISSPYHLNTKLSILNSMTGLYLTLRQKDKALDFSAKAIKFIGNHQEEHFEKLSVADSYSTFAQINEGENKGEKVKEAYAQAISYLNKADLSSPNALVKAAKIYLASALYLEKSNFFSEAISNYKLSGEQFKKLVQLGKPEHNYELGINYFSIAMCHKQLGDLVEAESYVGKAIRVSEKILEPDSSNLFKDLVDYYFQFGFIKKKNNKLIGAEKAYLESLSFAEKSGAYPYPNATLGSIWNNIGNIQKLQERWTEAENSYLQAIAIRNDLVKQHRENYLPSVEAVMQSLVEIYFKNNEFEKAESLYKDLMAILEELVPKNTHRYLPNLISTLNEFAQLYLQNDDYQTAEHYFNEAFRIGNNPKLITDLRSYLNLLAETQLNLAKFYQKNIPHQERSIAFAQAISNTLKPHSQLDIVKKYLEEVNDVMEYWNESHIE
ncbi:MAG: tetratricopeptide repeat protein [Flavobacteriaceae bacterium]